MHYARSALLATATALMMLPTLALAAETDDAAAAEARLLLLLDSSRSMEDPDADGDPKIEAAKAATRAVVDQLGDQQQVGLRLFGGAVELDQPLERKCTDSDLVVPIEAGNSADLRAAVEAYQPLGETPIAYALQQAADDLGGEGNRTILLVSDGIATCDPDPCEVAEELTADGLDLVVHTVGLGVDDETRDQLRCVAQVGGGTYYDADDTESLTAALTRVSTRAFRPFTLAGDEVAGAPTAAAAPVLRPGQYLDVLPVKQEAYYLVERSSPGTSLHVGATMRPGGDVGTSAFTLELSTLDGRGCDLNTARVWTAGASNNFGSTDVTGYADHRDPDDPCGTEDQLVLSIAEQRSSTLGGHPVELWVAEEPAATDTATLPSGQEDVQWQGPDLAPGGEPVVGGTSFNDAEPLEPGQTYSGDIVPGEALVFSVPVDWGQHVEALVEFPAPSPALADYIGTVSTAAEIEIYGPDRGEVVDNLADTGDLRTKSLLSTDARARVAGLSYGVRWNNRSMGNPTSADRAGDYYLVLTMVSDSNDSVPLPFSLVVDAAGQANGAPAYLESTVGDDDAADSDGSSEAESAARSEPAEDRATATSDPADAAAGAAVEESTGVPVLVWVLAGFGVLIAVTGLWFLARPRTSGL